MAPPVPATPDTSEVYVSSCLEIIHCWPDLELGRFVESNDLTEQGVAFRRLDARWYRWLHERAMLARKQGHALPEWDRVREQAVARYGEQRVAVAEAMTLPAGYRKPEVRR
jgi:hypothetical protein